MDNKVLEMLKNKYTFKRVSIKKEEFMEKFVRTSIVEKIKKANTTT